MSDLNDKLLSQKVVNCIRLLSADGVEKAKSGHPGLPLGCAEIVYVLWQKYLKFNPEEPDWINRDRFILSAGHGSMLLYSMLHLYGYDLPLEELKRFRQWESKTPGHPEYGLTPGVEITSGPLGQGLSNAVGMAIGYEILRKKLSKDGYSPLNHKIYVLVSDGDMMEGVASEAASIAGHLNLTNLTVIYDDNNITIEGDTSLTFSEDVGKRFEAYGWNVLKMDGNNIEEVDKVLQVASKKTDSPTLIIAKTKIARGSGLEGSHKAHGAPLGGNLVAEMKKKLGFSESEYFYIPEDVKEVVKARVIELKQDYEKWIKEFNDFLNENPEIKKDYENYKCKPNIDINELLNINFKKDKLATRVASGIVMQEIAKKVPGLIGGSADLAPSTNTYLEGLLSFNKDTRDGRNFHFGIREHAMGAILNGISLYDRNLIPYGATFLVFSDYMRPAIRLAALMKLHVLYVFTHDSIFVGEDGPTHQPVEQVWSLRNIPGLDVIRPADAYETVVAWWQAVNNDKNPTALILTRQNVPVLDKSRYSSAENLLKGAYIKSEEKDKNNLKIILIATGSEIFLALEVQNMLDQDGISTRVVSMPSIELFDRQSEDYKEIVLPRKCLNRVVIEAGISGGWYKYIGLDGLVCGINHFGASAPFEVLTDKFGFTAEKIYDKIKSKFKI